MINVATIGSSIITEAFGRAVAQVEGISLHTATSRDAARAAEIARRIGAPHAASDLDAVLADPAIDAAIACHPAVMEYIRQDADEIVPLDHAVEELVGVFGQPSL